MKANYCFFGIFCQVLGSLVLRKCKHCLLKHTANLKRHTDGTGWPNRMGVVFHGDQDDVLKLTVFGQDRSYRRLQVARLFTGFYRVFPDDDDPFRPRLRFSNSIRIASACPSSTASPTTRCGWSAKVKLRTSMWIFTEIYWVLLSFYGFYWVPLGPSYCTAMNWFVPSYRGLHWVPLGFTALVSVKRI